MRRLPLGANKRCPVQTALMFARGRARRRRLSAGSACRTIEALRRSADVDDSDAGLGRRRVRGASCGASIARLTTSGDVAFARLEDRLEHAQDVAAQDLENLVLVETPPGQGLGHVRQVVLVF